MSSVRSSRFSSALSGTLLPTVQNLEAPGVQNGYTRSAGIRSYPTDNSAFQDRTTGRRDGFRAAGIRPVSGSRGTVTKVYEKKESQTSWMEVVLLNLNARVAIACGTISNAFAASPGFSTASVLDPVFSWKFHFLWYFRCYLSDTNLPKIEGKKARGRVQARSGSEFALAAVL